MRQVCIDNGAGCRTEVPNVAQNTSKTGKVVFTWARGRMRQYIMGAAEFTFWGCMGVTFKWYLKKPDYPRGN